MSEELLVTARENALIDPSLHIWTWEVAMYLFMGGLTAGIMFFAALMTVRNKEDVAPLFRTVIKAAKNIIPAVSPPMNRYIATSQVQMCRLGSISAFSLAVTSSSSDIP